MSTNMHEGEGTEEKKEEWRIRMIITGRVSNTPKLRLTKMVSL